MIESEHGKGPHAAADALNAEKLPLEVSGRRDFRRDHEIAIQFVNDTGYESEIETRGHGAKARARRGHGIELRFVGSQRRDSHLPVSHLNDLNVQARLFEKAHVFGDENIAGAFVESGEDEYVLLQRH